MNKTLWIHQFDQWPIADIPSAVAAQGFNRVCIKALDGPHWMAQFDKSSDAISGPTAVESWVMALEGRGVTTDLWVVPTRENIIQQVGLWRDLINSTGVARLILDCEPYAGFWGEDDFGPLARILDPWEPPSNRLGITYDARDLGVTRVLAGYASVEMPQLYSIGWTTYWQPWRMPVEPLVDANATPGDWAKVLGYPPFARSGLSGFGVFRAPIAGLPGQLDFLRGIP